ncbi:MAG: S8 family serine peptidase [Candidatus Eisenbacteria bacterium]|nr:S8 family serine peptidase [Candidatus Eisenbacteria bacterium]
MKPSNFESRCERSDQGMRLDHGVCPKQGIDLNHQARGGKRPVPRSAGQPLVRPCATLLTLALFGTSLFACGEGRPSHGVSGSSPEFPVPTVLGEIDPSLRGPSVQQGAVVVATQGAIAGIAAEYGLTALESLPLNSGGYLVLYEHATLFDPLVLEGEAEVEAADQNAATNLADAQTLVVGFYEEDQPGGWVDGVPLSTQPALASLKLDDLAAYGGGAGVKIALLDTGVDWSHEVLASQRLPLPPGYGFEEGEYGNGLDDDGDGHVDEAFGHGTHVAGSILAVAPQAQIVSLRVLNDDGIGSLWDIARAVEVAIALDVDLINCSLSLSALAPTFEAILDRAADAGIVVVSASGNYGRRYPRYPATSTLVAGVAAVDGNDLLTIWSGASVRIPLAAPGVSIVSTYPGNKFKWASGTSMATGITTGAVAVVMHGASLNASDALAALEAEASPVTPSIAIEYGRIDPVAVLTP